MRESPFVSRFKVKLKFLWLLRCRTPSRRPKNSALMRVLSSLVVKVRCSFWNRENRYGLTLPVSMAPRHGLATKHRAHVLWLPQPWCHMTEWRRCTHFAVKEHGLPSNLFCWLFFAARARRSSPPMHNQHSVSGRFQIKTRNG